jgi:hypothetical protein
MTEAAGKAESLISACILFYCNATTTIWVRMRVAPVARSAAAGEEGEQEEEEEQEEEDR